MLQKGLLYYVSFLCGFFTWLQWHQNVTHWPASVTQERLCVCVCVFLWRVTCFNVLKAPLASPCEIYYRKIQKNPMVSSPQWPSVWYVTVEENISGTWSHANGASCNWFDRQLVIWSGYRIIWYNSLMLKWNAWVGSVETLLLCSLVTELWPVLEWLSSFLQLYHLGQENQAKRGKQI